MSTIKLIESMQNSLTEKINKDNIEINRAIANVNRGKNADKVKAAGYEVNYDYDGKPCGVTNPKTNRRVSVHNSNVKNKKDKVDFKNQLDTPVKSRKTTRREPYSYEEDYKKEYNTIPKSAKVGKDERGNTIYNDDELDSYSPARIDDDKKSISNNINDYKKSIRDEKEANKYSGYYEKDAERKRAEIEKANAELNRYETERDKYNNAANDAIQKRKDIIARRRAERQNKTNEDAHLTEAGLANLKTIDDFDDLDDFNQAIEDDKETILNTLEELKPRLNLKGSVDLIDSIKDQAIKQVTLYNN